jgi:hypothetical protein
MIKREAQCGSKFRKLCAQGLGRFLVHAVLLGNLLLQVLATSGIFGFNSKGRQCNTTWNSADKSLSAFDNLMNPIPHYDQTTSEPISTRRDIPYHSSHYVDVFLYLHGEPTWSYLYR